MKGGGREVERGSGGVTLHRRRKEIWTEPDLSGIHVSRRTGRTTSGSAKLTAEEALCWFSLCGGGGGR